MIRTYKLRHDINGQKQDKMLLVIRAYRKTCAIITKVQWRLFFQEDGFNKMIKTKNIASTLSERYKRNCCYQVEATLSSFISNRQNDFIKKVYSYDFNEEVRKHLLQINRRQLWFKKEHKLFSTEELFLARKMFKHILSKHRKPSFRHINMLLNKNVAEIIIADKTKTIGFDYWIKLSTLDKGKPIMLPIKTNKYFEGIKGKLKQAIQFNMIEQQQIQVAFMKEVAAKRMTFKTDAISIDIGLKNLFALNNGDIFSRNFYARLKHYDSILTKLASNRQKQGLKTKSRRYKLLTKRLKNWMKNEVNRSLNRIIKLYAPKKIVIERLDFRNQHLSKQMNRLLCNFGKGQIIKKLDSLKEEFAIEYQEINPAYTSQECPACGYVDKNNRQTQEHFRCKCCGYKRNADVVGAKNHLVRSSDKEMSNIYLTKNKILQKLVTRFLERNARHYSLANSLLQDNPYFKDYLGQLKRAA